MPLDNPANVTTVAPVVQMTLTDHSGTITAANTSQQIMAANPARQYLLFENISSKPMWVNFGVAAVTTQPSILVNGGGSLIMEGPTVSSEVLNVICATVGVAFVAKEG